MRTTGSVVLILIVAAGITIAQDNKAAVKCISTCEVDLNGDSTSDIAMLIESSRGRQLIVLLGNDTGYSTIVVSDSVDSGMLLSCDYGKYLTETQSADSGDGAGQQVETPGAYLILSQPEGAAAAYYWSHGRFQEIWIAD